MTQAEQTVRSSRETVTDEQIVHLEHSGRVTPSLMRDHQVPSRGISLLKKGDNDVCVNAPITCHRVLRSYQFLLKRNKHHLLFPASKALVGSVQALQQDGATVNLAKN